MKTVAVLGANQFQFQRIADHLVITHDALEHLTQTGAGHQRITECMEGGRADETRHAQADCRIAADLHGDFPQARGTGQRITGVRVVHQLRVEPRLLAQSGAVQAKRIELLAQGAGPTGEGGRFSHVDWRFRSTGWRSRLLHLQSSQARM